MLFKESEIAMENCRLTTSSRCKSTVTHQVTQFRLDNQINAVMNGKVIKDV